MKTGISSRKMRVLYIFSKDTASLGGSIRVGETLIRHLDAEKVVGQAVFIYGEPGAVSAGLPIESHFIRAQSRKDPKAWVRLRSTIRKFRPDVIHFIDPVFWAHCASLGLPTVRLWHLHGPWGGNRITKSERFRLHVLKRTVDGYISISEGARQEMIQNGWTTLAKSWVAYNAIDLARYRELGDRSLAREELQVPKDCRLLVMLCRLTPSKGCGEAVRLLRFLPGDWHLVIAGDGHYRPDLVKIAQRDGTSNRLHLTNWLNDPRCVYSAADIYLFMSHSEPFGLVLAEAMASGKPVFGLNGLGEYREAALPLITDDNSFLLERPAADLERDPFDGSMEGSDDVLADLASHIESKWHHGEDRERVVAAAQSWVTQRFGGHRLAEDVTRIYQQALLAGPHRANWVLSQEVRGS